MAVADPTRILARMDALTPSDMGMSFPEDTSYEEWANLGPVLGLMERASRWWIGDWINFGERRYGEKHSQAIERTGLAYETLNVCRWVASKYEFVLRRTNLSWSHHKELAALPTVEAGAWLDASEEFGWSVQRLRQEIQRARQPLQSVSDAPEYGQLSRGDAATPVHGVIVPFVAPSMAVHYSSADDDWHTPWPILDCAAAMLGGIDLDPCADAGRKVPAARHYTEAEDGLAQYWRARTVWLNPPYGRAIGDWVEKLRAEYDAGNVTEALTLLPARTDTEWWQGLRPTAVCFLRGRLHFSNSDNPAPFPSALAYLGPRPAAFAAAFRGIGQVWLPWEGVPA